MKIFLLLLVFVLPLFADDFPGACRLSHGPFNSEEGGCIDLSQNTVYSLSPRKKFNYADALSYCTSLEEGGHKGWTLPSRQEIQKTSASGITAAVLPFQIVDFFWALTNGNGLDAWTVSLKDGEFIQAERSDSHRVVCVRHPSDMDKDGVPDSSDLCNLTRAGLKVDWQGEAKGCSRGNDYYFTVKQALERQTLGCKEESQYFYTSTAGCTDNRTKVTYSRSPGRPMTFAEAKRYCDGLSEGVSEIYTNWVLPSVKELSAISGPELGKKHFKFAFEDTFWTHENYTGNTYGVGRWSRSSDNLVNGVKVSNGDTLSLVIGTSTYTERHYSVGYNVDPGGSTYSVVDTKAQVICVLSSGQ